MMPRGRGYSSNHRGYRGGSYRGNSPWSGNSNRGGYSGSSTYNSFSTMEAKHPYENKYKYSNSERFSRSDDYHKSYRSNSYNSNVGRERRSPPDRKRMRLDAPSSRHESYYGSSRHEPPPPPYIERRLSSERHQSTPFARREEFRRPQSPPKRGSLRGKFSPRGQRGLRFAGRPMRRRLVDSSYVVRKRIIPRGSDYTRRIKLSGLRSGIAARKRQPFKPKEHEEEEDDDEDDDDDEEPPAKEEKIEEIEEKRTEEDAEQIEAKRKRKAFIKLHCPHCGMKALTFRRYEIHLRHRGHLMAMRQIALKQKAIIKQMRQAQRNTQNELEKSSEGLSSRTNFCPLCKLNYKQKKTVHQLSEAHKNMKKFLMPFCKVCNISFKSPMVFENHCCSIDHIKREQRMENSDCSGEEDNLENFTTIDSVGDVDGEGSEVEEKKDEKEVPTNVGIEKIRKIEAYYCDICKMYLQRGEESEIPKILGRHCKQRVHVTRYHRIKEAQESEKKVAKKEASETEALKQDINEKDQTKEEEEEAKDDKLWADVDKDLGDILAEAESGIKSSDEDDDSHVNGERFDRFKLSKNGDEKLMSADEEGILDSKLIIEGETKK